jgi:hypothetical protein
MADQSPLANQAALETVQKLLANIESTENTQLAHDLLSAMFSNKTVSAAWNDTWEGENWVDAPADEGPEWYRNQKAKEQGKKQLDLVPLVPQEEPPLPPIATEPDEVSATPRQVSKLDHKITTNKQRKLEKDIESRTLQPSDPQARLDESVGEEAYLAKKKLEKEPSWSVTPSLPSMTVEPSRPTKEIQEKMAAQQQEAEEKRIGDIQDASLDLMLQKNAVEADILTEKLNQSRLDLQREEGKYQESMMSLTPAERIKYGL